MELINVDDEARDENELVDDDENDMLRAEND